MQFGRNASRVVSGWKLRWFGLGLVIATLVPAAEFRAQTGGVIHGTIVDAATKRPLPLATAIVKDTRFGAAADSSGRFRITGVPPGMYVVEFRHLSYKTKFRVANVVEGETIELQMELDSEAIPLSEITVVDTVRLDRLIHKFPGSLLLTRDMLLEASPSSLTEALQQLAPRYDLFTARQRGRTRPSRGAVTPMLVRNILIVIDNVRIYPDAQEMQDSPYWLDKLVDVQEIEMMVIHRGDNAWLRAGRRGERLDWLVEIQRRKR
jgi:hypothetical protein